MMYIPKHFEALKNAKFNEQGPVGDSPATGLGAASIHLTPLSPLDVHS